MTTTELTELDRLLKCFDDQGRFTRQEQQAVNVVMGLVGRECQTAMYLNLTDGGLVKQL